jgi:UDP-glucose 4-epimerase
VKKATDRKSVMESAVRPSAPVRLVASSQKIDKELVWKAEYSLEQITESAWKWHKRKEGGGQGDSWC